MKSAEFRTLREICGVSRDDLARKYGVNSNTLRQWDKPHGIVPKPVLDYLRDLNTEIYTLAQMMLSLNPTALPWLREIDTVTDAKVWNLAVGRVVGIHPVVQTFFFSEPDYNDFLAKRALPHTERNLMAWACDALPRQAIPHSSDQPTLA